MAAKPRATIADLYDVPEDSKAEIVDGELVLMSPTGDQPNRAAGSIYFNLCLYERGGHPGRAYTDNAAFVVNSPRQRSFSPDAAYYVGPRTGGKFLEGAPVFAAEVRSERDYGPRAEREIAAKRSAYFAAGTQVVWDVDVLREQVVRVYRATDPGNPTIYHRGDTAEAEPALPGWTMPVEELFT